MIAGTLLRRLPLVDPRGPQELGALARAYVAHAWRNRHENKRPIPRNTIRFGRAVKA